MLSQPRSWVQSLVRELRSRKPHGMAGGGGGWGLGKGEESRVSIGINFSDQLPILDLRRANVQLHSLALRIYSIEIAPLCILSQNKAT